MSEHDASGNAEVIWHERLVEQEEMVPAAQPGGCSPSALCHLPAPSPVRLVRLAAGFIVA